MKRFNTWLNKYLTPTDRLIAEAFEKSIARSDKPDGTTQYVCDPRVAASFCPADRRLAEWMAIFGGRCFRDKDSVDKEMVLAGLATQGVRVYAPTVDECHALMQVELKVPVSVYRQPFETMVVVFPDDLYPRDVSADVGKPSAIVGRFCPERFDCLSVLIPGTGSYDLHARYDFAIADPHQLIEPYIQACPSYGDPEPDESAVTASSVRLFINANMLLTKFGARRLGVVNPEYEAKLRASLDKKRLPEAARAANEHALKAMPVLYGFDQHVRIYEQEGAATEGGAGGYEVKPHWRRGHWANQVHGAGGALRKLVFRPAVLVNAHRFGGAASDTRVTMTTGGAA